MGMTPARYGLAGTQPLLMIGMWLILVLTALYTRPLWPINETRYVSVAWEMWLRGDFLVPYLNGEPYSHKPPLMFWLFQAGWWVFGVNDWWPRLVPSLFALANLFLTARLARLLWPQHETAVRHVPLILLGCLLWTFFTTVTLFDMLLTCFTLLGLLGVLHVWRNGGVRGWLILGVAIGMGVLSKGPVILLHTLPVALLAPWWAVGSGPSNWKSWYGGIVLAIVLGTGIALAWAIPAAWSGGPAYGHALFWAQTADRLVESFAHRRTWWWYLPLLPVFLLPWSVWPPLWRGLKKMWAESRGGAVNPGVRFCLAWLAPVFLALSAISGKQVQYLLPTLPAFALLISYAVFMTGNEIADRDGWWPGLSLFLLGTGLACIPYLSVYYPAAEWVTHVSPVTGLVVALSGILFAVFAGKQKGRSVSTLMLTSVLLIVMVQWGVVRTAAPAFDLKAIGKYLNSLQQAGYPIAHVHDYYGQYQFVGRLREPLQVIARAEIIPWIEAHPSGRIVIYSGDSYPHGIGKPEYIHPYRGLTFSVWTRAALLMNLQ
ncbi:MAG: glycosyltransferase family 39 protein [Gammaproteobacteria bacterium]